MAKPSGGFNDKLQYQSNAALSSLRTQSQSTVKKGDRPERRRKETRCVPRCHRKVRVCCSVCSPRASHSWFWISTRSLQPPTRLVVFKLPRGVVTRTFRTKTPCNRKVGLENDTSDKETNSKTRQSKVRNMLLSPSMWLLHKCVISSTISQTC